MTDEERQSIRAAALDDFSVWLLKTHGLLIDESLLTLPPDFVVVPVATMVEVRESLKLAIAVGVDQGEPWAGVATRHLHAALAALEAVQW